MKTKYSGKYSLTKSLYGLKKRKKKYSLEEALVYDENDVSYEISDEMMQQIKDMDKTTGTRAKRAAQQRASQGKRTRLSTEDGASRAHVMENQTEFKEIAAALGGADEMVKYLKAFQIKGSKSNPKSPLSGNVIKFMKGEQFRISVTEVLYKDSEDYEDKKEEIIADLGEGSYAGMDLSEANPNTEIIVKLKDFLNNAAGRVEEAIGISAAREELANVRASLEARFTKSLPIDQAKKDARTINDLTEDLAGAGMGANFMKKTIKAVARLQAADMEYIKSATFPANTQDWTGFPEAMQYLFDIADGSRGQNLGRGEIAAYYHFKNIKTPDLASGVFDLETDGGVSMHVKHLTGAREDNQNETIPSKKDALLDAFGSAYVNQTGDGKNLTLDNFTKKFKGNSKGSNVAISNLVDWLNDNIPENLSNNKRKAAATQWVNDNVPLLNDACHDVAIDGAGVLFFKGTGGNIEYKYVAPGDKDNVFFERTDASGVGITMREDKSINVQRVTSSGDFTKLFP